MDEFNLSNLNSFGCVVIDDDIPHLFIMDDIYLLEGIPIFDDNELYTTLGDNELILVGVNVKDEEGDEDFDITDIDDDNYDELTYVVTPLKFYTLKSQGLINEDLMDMGLFELLINNLIDGYIDNLQII